MNIKEAISNISSLKTTDSFGKISKVIGLVIEGKGLNTSIGSVCEVIIENGQSFPAEVVGFRNSTVLLMLWGTQGNKTWIIYKKIPTLLHILE